MKENMKIMHFAVVLMLIFSSINSFAESKKDPLWEKKINAKIKWQKELAHLLISKSPDFKDLIEIQRDLQLTQIEIQTALYYYFLENEPTRIEHLRDQYYAFSWSDEDEEKLIESDSRYKKLIERKSKLKTKNKNHPMWPELREVFAEIKNDSQHQRLYRQLMDTLKEIDNFLGPAQKTYFEEGEYGSLYWQTEANTDWPYNWKFRTKTNFKLLEIVIFDQTGKREVLIDNETMNGHAPIEFGFRLNTPEFMGNMADPTLSIPFGYSRIAVVGKNAMGLSNWAHIEGDKLIDAVYDHNPSFDNFNKSGEIILATYKTSDAEKEYTYIIKIRYE